jgi:hypothetical protein
MRLLLACCGLALFTGCLFASDSPDDGSGPPPASCNPEPTYEIDTGATLSYAVGVDAGYYSEYEGSGAWHFEWTCDTDLSAEGCTFSGSIIAQTPAGGVNATCYKCESDDTLTSSPNGANTEIDFNTDTSTGIDGVDFVTTPGASIAIDFQINGLYQNDLVFIPSGGTAANPTCMPANLAPSTP